MPEKALPCIVCGIGLDNVNPKSVENQPYDGVYCTTKGNYGSTVFDSTDGEHLEFNVCDECLVEAGEQGRVLSTKHERPVVGPNRVFLGWERVDRPYVPWKKGTPGYGKNDICEIYSAEEFEKADAMVDTYGRKKIKWQHSREQTLRMIEQGLDDEKQGADSSE